MNGYDNKVDIWCVGVIIFELLFGRIPFIRKDRNILMSNIVNGRIFRDDNIDIDARDLISKILIVELNLKICFRRYYKI